MRLLLVEDDPMIGASVQNGLRQEAWSVDWVRTGEAAELALSNGVYELLLLDLGLPGKSGLELLTRLRKRGDALPVLVITARDSVADRVKGLDAGADDYLPKPFEPRELVARIHNILRRSGDDASMREIKPIKGIEVDPSRREVKLDHAVLDLTTMEYELLILFMQYPNKTFTRNELMNRLRGIDAELFDDGDEIDHVSLGFRHLGGRDDLHRAAILQEPATVAQIHLLREVIHRPPLRMAGLEDRVRHHALREQGVEGLDGFGGQMAGGMHRAGEKAGIQEVQDRVLNPANILVHGKPAGDFAAIERRAIGLTGEAEEIPA